MDKKIYTVTFQITTVTSVDVTAKGREEAEKEAWKEFNRNRYNQPIQDYGVVIKNVKMLRYAP
jgi:hypothetical protein